jgi:hypothetical protein
MRNANTTQHDTTSLIEKCEHYTTQHYNHWYTTQQHVANEKCEHYTTLSIKSAQHDTTLLMKNANTPQHYTTLSIKNATTTLLNTTTTSTQHDNTLLIKNAIATQHDTTTAWSHDTTPHH